MRVSKVKLIKELGRKVKTLYNKKVEKLNLRIGSFELEWKKLSVKFRYVNLIKVQQYTSCTKNKKLELVNLQYKIKTRKSPMGI